MATYNTTTIEKSRNNAQVRYLGKRKVSILQMASCFTTSLSTNMLASMNNSNNGHHATVCYSVCSGVKVPIILSPFEVN